jgi:hypothetical protein
MHNLGTRQCGAQWTPLVRARFFSIEAVRFDQMAKLNVSILGLSFATCKVVEK